MYAAAGGASLASRQARQRQRQQKKTQLQQAKLHPPKASVLSVAEHGASTPTRSLSRQFHQLPTSYLRTPQSQNRKLSAGYTTQSKLLLPIDEGDSQSVLHMRMQPHGSHHSHSHGPAYAPHNVHPYAPPTPSAHPHLHLQSYADEIVTPKAMHRHSGGSSASFRHVPLPKSATASMPLVSQIVEPTPPTSPAGAAAVMPTYTPTTMTTTTIAVPHHDDIIVTPATPMASPGHVPRLRETDDLDLPETSDEKVPLTSGLADDESDESSMQPPSLPLERKCSVYRMRRTDDFEYKDLPSVSFGGTKRQFKELQLNQQLQLQQEQLQLQLQQQHQEELEGINIKQYEPIPIDDPVLLYKGLPSGRKFQMCAYCEDGICACEHIECAQGRAAWLERDRRRCSVQEKELAKEQAAVHRRWVKRNRIQDASYGGSSDDEDFLGVLRGPSTFANAFLYVGLGTIALGLVIAFVGTGEKGFKTVELRLIGPSLIGLGLICCILRILFCICPSHCISSKKKTRKKNGNKVDADHTTSLLRGESKRVSIARGPIPQPKYPISHRRSQSKMLNEGMEALRQLATTSLFMQNEQKPALNRVVPVINEPEQSTEVPLEMKKLMTTLNVCDEEDEDDIERNELRKMTDKKIDKKVNKTKTKTAVIKSTTKSKRRTNKINVTTTTTRTEESAIGSQALNRQITVTSEPDETSTPCIISNTSNNNNNNNNLPLTSTSNLLGTNTTDVMMQETSLMVVEPTTINIEGIPSISVPPSNNITTTTTTTTTSPTTIFKIPTTYTGAISRIPLSMTSYDLPPSQPFTYAAGRLVSAGDRIEPPPPLIRGPLGMPMSALTASSSTYAMPSTSNYHYRNKPLPASSSAPGAATNTILKAATTATATEPSITFSSRERYRETLYLPEQLQIASTTTISSTVSSTAPTKTSSPATLSTSSSSSYIHKPPPLLSTTPSGSGTSSIPTNGRATLALPGPANKFEPELLLSPSKLGQ